jgi:hypothetical protein
VDNIPVEEARRIFEEAVNSPDNPAIASLKQKLEEKRDYEPTSEDIATVEDWVSKPKIWLNIITPVDLWNYCLDSKFDIVEAMGMCYPLHDKGILGALRVAQIHKSLCLRKFEKYIYSYVIGGSLVRGETKPTSDVDVL